MNLKSFLYIQKKSFSKKRVAYHYTNFKFNLSELNNFPEYMDFDELYNYVVVQNKNKNIIYVKNKN